MNDYAQLFRSVAKDLASKGIDAEFSDATPCDEDLVLDFEQVTNLKMPGSLKEFYTKFSDGFAFQWERSEDCWGCLAFPEISELTDETRSWQGNVRDFADDPKSMDRCIEPKHRPRAFEIWREMKNWIPIAQEANGDQFCVRPGGSIVYHQHDWFDGFGEIAKTNGHLAGKTLFEFIRNWSRYYFMPPKNHWWGALAKDGPIAWQSKYFSSELS